MNEKFLDSFLSVCQYILIIVLVFYICGAVQCSEQNDVLLLINRLDDNRQVKREAIKRLVEIGDTATNSLIYALNNKNSKIRREIPGILLRLKPPGVIMHLIRALQDRDWRAAESAYDALLLMKEDALEALVPLLENGDDFIKVRAIRLIETIANDIIEKERGHSGGKRRRKLRTVLRPLTALLRNKNPVVKAAALRALGAIKDPGPAESIFPLLEDDRFDIRIKAIQTLGALENNRAVEPLVKLLDKENWRVRMEAAMALGWVNDKRAVMPLLDRLNDVDWRVRHRAMIALGMLKDKRAVQPLIDLFNKEKNITIKRLVVYSLGLTSDASAVGFLDPVLGHNDEEVRENAVFALQKIGKPSVPTLIKALKNQDKSFQSLHENIIEALETIGDKRAVEPVIGALKNKNSRVRWQAVTTLGKFKDKRAFRPLLDALKDKDDWVRRNVVGVFGDVKDPRAIDAIKKISETDPDGHVRREAESALKKIGENRIEVVERFEDAGKKVENFYKVFWDTKTLVKQKHYNKKSKLTKVVNLTDHTETRYTYFRWNSLNLRADYKNGRLHGKVMEWDRGGILRKEELWENGKLIKKLK